MAKVGEPARAARRKSYSEKLRDPRWQKRRLEILERDEWTCQSCEATEHTLHVHHRYYTKGQEPWEAADEALLTLCEFCHEAERTERPAAEERLLRAIRGSLVSYEVDWLAEVFEEMPREVCKALAAGAVRWDACGATLQWLKERRDAFVAWLEDWEQRNGHPDG